VVGSQIWLFFLASFHADIVFGLACLCRIVFCAGLLLLATLLATVRLFRLYRGDAAKTEEHDDGSGDESHGHPPLNATQRPDGTNEQYTIFSRGHQIWRYLRGCPTIRILGSKIKSGLHDAIALEKQKSDTNNNGRPARRRSTLQHWRRRERRRGNGLRKGGSS
jgi:hypothetical protein